MNSQGKFYTEFDLNLSSQTVRVTISHTNEIVERPLLVEHGVRYLAPNYTVRDLRKFKTNGEIVTTTINVQGCRIKVKFEDGFEIEQRACCKPPDNFNFKKGLKEAFRRLIKVDSGISLNRFQKGHCKILFENQRERIVWVKGGKPVVDPTVKPRLTGQDRKILIAAILRLGKKKDFIKKIDQLELDAVG